MGVIVNTGLDRLVRIGLGIVPQVGMVARLWVNNYTPSFTSTLANFTECTNPGYTPAVITVGSWVGSTVGGLSTYLYPPIAFNFTATGSPQTVYGYLVEDSDNSELLWAGRFLFPYAIAAGGSLLRVNINYQDQSIPV